MKLQKDLEAACDCTIKWDEILDTQWSQQSSTVLASGDVADITIWGYNSDNFAQYDYWEDLSDDLDQMPNVKAYFKAVPNAEKFGSDIDGHVWQVPSDYGNAPALSGPAARNLMINKSWLEKLGLDVPKTWDDLTKVLIAFKNDDPNGNGEADEIPMLINQLGTAGFNWWDPFLLLNGTGLNTQVISTAGSKGIYVKDGKIGNFMITDNFRQVIEYYHSLIEKGLMPKDILTRDGSQNTADISNDGQDRQGRSDLRLEHRQLRRSEGSVRVHRGSGSSGVSYEETTWEPRSKISTTALASMLHLDEAHKTAALKVIDKWITPDMSMESYYGDLDTYISNEGDGKYNVLKFQDDLSTFGLADRGLTWVSDDMSVSGDEDKVLAEKDGKTYETQQSHIGDKDLIPAYVRLSAEDNTTVSNNNSNIFNYAMPLISTWIQDGGLTDDAWNEYVSTMKQQGVDENVKLWQKWYDKTMAQE